MLEVAPVPDLQWHGYNSAFLQHCNNMLREWGPRPLRCCDDVRLRPRARTVRYGRQCGAARAHGVRPRQAVGHLDQPPRPLHCQRAASRRSRPPRTAVYRRPSAILLFPRLRALASNARDRAGRTATSKDSSGSCQSGVTRATSICSRNRSRGPRGSQWRWGNNRWPTDFACAPRSRHERLCLCPNALASASLDGAASSLGAAP